jgi:hypothetical protein
MSLFHPLLRLGRSLSAVAVDANQYTSFQPLLMEVLQAADCGRAKLLQDWSCLWLKFLGFSLTHVEPARRNNGTRSRAVFTNSFCARDSIRGGMSQSDSWNTRHVRSA